MNNFWQRLSTGVLFTSILIGSVIMSGWYLQAVMGVLALLTLQEFYKLFTKSPYSPDYIIGPILGLAIYFLFLHDLNNGPEDSNYFLPTLLLVFPLLAVVELFRKKPSPFQNIGLSLLGMVYILTPFIMINLLAINPEPDPAADLHHIQIDQIWPILAIFLIVWANDTFAYLIGKQWGKRKLFERISPKKSWEGFFGGFLFALICAGLIGYFLEGAYVEYLTYAAIISVIGTFGDLIESLLKRSLKVKDSGKILPGHGGLLDRLDALLFAIPFIYICHVYIF